MNFEEGAKEIRNDLLEYQKRIRASFVSGAYQIHAGIVKKFYTAPKGSSVGLARRTGNAAKSWKVNVKKNKDSVVCSIYSAGAPYADFSEGKFIRPKNKKWLTIPVGPALTASGAARYPGGARQASKALSMPDRKSTGAYLNRQFSGGKKRDPLSFVLSKTSPNTAFLIAKKGVRGTGLSKNNRLMFVLKKVVKRPAKTAGLMPWIDGRVTTLISRISSSQSGSSTLDRV